MDFKFYLVSLIVCYLMNIAVSQNGGQCPLNELYTKFEQVKAELQTIHKSLLALGENSACNKCGIFGNWRRIAYFNTTGGDSCPSGLRTVKNPTTSQTACGRTTSPGCNSLKFSPNGSFTRVCGRVKGYSSHSPDAFAREHLRGDSIDSPYMDGISFTYGTPRKHLWSYVAGWSEHSSFPLRRCPCARTNPEDRTNVPNFVQNDFYCESGHSRNRVNWEDPLWDGKGCSSNNCCDQYGWFHREVPRTTQKLEVRWCGDESTSNEDVLTDQLEIWVM